MKTLTECEHPKWSNTVKYQERIVAFLDILGFKSMMRNTSIDITPIAGILTSINETFFDNKKHSKANLGGIEITSISDSIVISIQYSIKGSYDKLIRMVSAIITLLADHNMVIRGGISRGPLYHSNNVVFGPAFVQAYELHEQFAVYPRCIIDKVVEDDLLILGKQKKGVFNYFLEDFDGMKYFDFFLYLIENIPRDERYLQTLKRIRDLIIDNLRAFNNPKKLLDLKIWGKYEWCAVRFNKTLQLKNKYLDMQIDDKDIYRTSL